MATVRSILSVMVGMPLFQTRVCARHSTSRQTAVTKQCLHEEWSMDIDTAIDYEAQMQARCMHGNDFERAYHAFVEKRPPVFEGN